MEGPEIADGRDRVVRRGPHRAIQTGWGPFEVRCAKVRDRGDGGAEEKIRLTSVEFLPKWAQRTKSLDALLPVLYLRGVSTGDFQKALAALLGKDAPNLSPAVISRLTAEWQPDAWQKRDLSARYVYVWADGVSLQARMEEAAECMLVLTGATPEGKKELVGFQTVGEAHGAGASFSLTSSSVGSRLRRTWRTARAASERRSRSCWVHKTANLLNNVALGVQVNMKVDLREIYAAPTACSLVPCDLVELCTRAAQRERYRSCRRRQP